MSMPITIKIMSQEGLEPQRSAVLVMEAIKYKANVTLTFKGRTVNGKSMTEVMSLGAEYGDLLQIQAEGEEATELVNALIAVLQQN